MRRLAAEQGQLSGLADTEGRDKLASSAVSARFAMGGIKGFAIRREGQVIGVLNIAVTVLGSEPAGCFIESERMDRTLVPIALRRNEIECFFRASRYAAEKAKHNQQIERLHLKTPIAVLANARMKFIVARVYTGRWPL